MHLYHEQKTVFPVGASETGPNSAWATWMAYLLPYLEQQNLSSEFNFSQTDSVTNQAVYRIKVPTYCCPSDDADRSSPQAGGPGFVRSNVVGCFSPDGGLNESTSSKKRAVFRLNQSRSIADVSDGTSNTVAISEIISGPNGSQDVRGQWWYDLGCSYEHEYNPNSPYDAIPDWSWAPGYCIKDKVNCDSSGTSAGLGPYPLCRRQLSSGWCECGIGRRFRAVCQRHDQHRRLAGIGQH